MEPNNQQVNPVDNQQQTPQAVPQPVVATPQQAPQTPQAPKSHKKLIYGLLIGVVVIIVIAVLGFYLMKAPKNAEVAQVPAPTKTPTVTQEPEIVVNSASDLDGLLVGLAQADDTLDQELTSLEKDSDF
mgnify:CR=1 FL=1